MAKNKQPKFFIVLRGDPSEYYGSGHYEKTSSPNPGETIYHGKFVKRILEHDNGPNGVSRKEVYEPVDPKEVTSSRYAGEAEDVETF